MQSRPMRLIYRDRYPQELAQHQAVFEGQDTWNYQSYNQPPPFPQTIATSGQFLPPAPDLNRYPAPRGMVPVTMRQRREVPLATTQRLMPVHPEAEEHLATDARAQPITRKVIPLPRGSSGHANPVQGQHQAHDAMELVYGTNIRPRAPGGEFIKPKWSRPLCFPYCTDLRTFKGPAVNQAPQQRWAGVNVDTGQGPVPGMDSHGRQRHQQQRRVTVDDRHPPGSPGPSRRNSDVEHRPHPSLHRA